MTREEFREVVKRIDEKIDTLLEANADDHDALLGHVSRINGQVAANVREVGELKLGQAYAKGAVAMGGFIIGGGAGTTMLLFLLGRI